MSKNHPLTEDEFRQFVPPKRTSHYIEQFRARTGLSSGAIKILDWGCGRGMETLWLREQGYDAYGVDISPSPVANGRGLLKAKGYPEDCLRVLEIGGGAPFPDGFFHFTFSNQVFEHVGDLEAVAAELWRVTMPNGSGHHVFPAYRYFVEGHLYMPLVHWLPKNNLRKLAIWLCVLTGHEPHWEGLDDATHAERAARYFQYSIEKTYYRSPSTIREIFENPGFGVSFETINHPRVQRHPVLGRLARRALSRRLVDYLLLTFVSNELHLKKVC